MTVSARQLYIDLLIKILSNTIYEDPSIHPENAGRFQPELRSTGLDWPSVAHTMVGLQRLGNLRELTERVLAEGVPGDFIETGTWRGGCCILMRGILAAYRAEDRKVYVADSFEGLPPPDPERYPADKGLNLHKYKELAIPLEQVKDNFSRYDLLDERVVFVKGFFSDTLPQLEAGPFALIRLDGDLYESTYVALDTLYPKLSPGGFVIIDDMNCVPACCKAVMDYRERMGIASPIHAVDWAASWWRKE
jgi:O-methyltransferase